MGTTWVQHKKLMLYPSKQLIINTIYIRVQQEQHKTHNVHPSEKIIHNNADYT